MPSRRFFLNALAAAGLAAAALTGLQGAAMAQAPSPADLAVAGPMGDVELGNKDAKVTIYEYASMTCSHCAAFHKNTWPTLKSKYIDTGKVRFILREFPLDPLATAGFMLPAARGTTSTTRSSISCSTSRRTGRSRTSRSRRFWG